MWATSTLYSFRTGSEETQQGMRQLGAPRGTRNHKTSLLNNSDAGQEVSVGQLLPELHTLWVLGLFLINVINSSAKHRQACTAKPQKITWAHEKGTHTVQLKLKNILML